MLQKTFPTAGAEIAATVEEKPGELAQASFSRQIFEIVAFGAVASVTAAEVVETGLSLDFVARHHRYFAHSMSQRGSVQIAPVRPDHCRRDHLVELWCFQKAFRTYFRPVSVEYFQTWRLVVKSICAVCSFVMSPNTLERISGTR